VAKLQKHLLPKLFKEKGILMIKKLALFFIVLSGLLFAKTLVTVNGYKIDDSIIPKGYSRLSDEQMANLMEKLIKEELMHQYLLKSDIVQTQEFQKIFQEQKRLAQQEYQKVTGKSLTKPQIRNIKGTVALMLYQKRLLDNTHVSDSEAKSFYYENQDKFNFPNSIEIANIVVPTEQEAKNIIARLKNSQNIDEDFIKIAREHKQNGYMGWFGEGMAPDNLFHTAYKENPKTLITKPIHTKYGYHVVYLLNKKKAGKLSFQEAKDSIKALIKRKKVLEKLEDKINSLYSNAEIVY
jgi:parvulin-like peptidyl-prolyl isomerase